MKKHKLTITVIQPTSREIVVHESFYPLQCLAILAAWWYSKSYQCLVKRRVFDLETSIQPLSQTV